MRILERYVLREHLFPFAIGFSVVVFLLTLDFLFDLVDLAIGKGVSAGIVLELFALSMGWMLALAVPCAVLIATLATFGRLAQDNEIAAMRANGINLMRIVGAPLMAAAVLAGGLVLFNNHVLPETNHALANLMVDVSRKRPTAQISEGVFIDGFEGYNIFVEKVNNRTNEIRGVKIYQLNSSARPTTILADWGVFHSSPDGRVVTLELHDGEIHEMPPNDQERIYRRLMFKTHIINIRNAGSDLERSDSSARGDREMSLGMMRGQIHNLGKELAVSTAARDTLIHKAGFKNYDDFLKAAVPRQAPRGLVGFIRNTLRAISPIRPPASLPPGRPPTLFINPVTMDMIQMRQIEIGALDRRMNSLNVEIQKKFSIPAACIVFVLVGAPLGIRARKSGIGVAFISILFFVFYYLCLAGGEELADRRFLDPAVAMWTPNIVIGLIGLILTLQAAEIIHRPRRKSRRKPAA
ncbi:MAG TPA: LptF/LptG family permease [Candidatus Limnocylindrales bacterium]|jgi:lipopolysaccharide export system permease protein|nr:LptF/LptG family permease [Candidatus Limnocylindrales bacterium]